MLPNEGFSLTLMMHSVLGHGCASKRLDMRLREHPGLPSRSSQVEIQYIDCLRGKIKLTVTAAFKPCELSEQLAKEARSRSRLNSES
jgi:hypothetical protein